MMAATLAPGTFGLPARRPAVAKKPGTMVFDSESGREPVLQFVTFDASYLERLQRGDARHRAAFCQITLASSSVSSCGRA